VTRPDLALKLDRIAPALSAAQRAEILACIDEYAAHEIELCARSPRSQGGAGADAA
jgi:hypothetical protein